MNWIPTWPIASAAPLPGAGRARVIVGRTRATSRGTGGSGDPGAERCGRQCPATWPCRHRRDVFRHRPFRRRWRDRGDGLASIDYNGMKLVGTRCAPLDPRWRFRKGGARAFRRVQLAGHDRDFPENARGLCPRHCRFCRYRGAATVDGAGQCRQWHLATFDAIADELARGARPCALSAEPPARSCVPERHPKPASAGKPADDRRCRARAWRRSWVSLGRRFRPAFFDETGAFIPGEYIVGLLAAPFWKHPGEKIVHDPRVVLNTTRHDRRAGGQAVQARTGHAYLKRAMRESGAIYGGEMSAHHYFRDFISPTAAWCRGCWCELVSRQEHQSGRPAGPADARLSPRRARSTFALPTPMRRLPGSSRARRCCGGDDMDGIP